MLNVCYFDHVVPQRNWGPEDRHITDWVTGNYPGRSWILLQIASWMGLEEGKLAAIVQALTRVRDAEISAVARAILQGKKIHEAVAEVRGKKRHVR